MCGSLARENDEVQLACAIFFLYVRDFFFSKTFFFVIMFKKNS